MIKEKRTQKELKLFFKNEGIVKIVSDKQRLRDFFASKPAQQEILKELHQAKRKRQKTQKYRKGRPEMVNMCLN